MAMYILILKIMLIMVSYQNKSIDDLVSGARVEVMKLKKKFS